MLDRAKHDQMTESTAERFLSRLAERGIEYVFANSGTDFAPIIEALSGEGKSRGRFPRFITVPHENVAMAMAHGYYRTAGKPAAVMVHVSVGTANTICGLMNAARDRIPTFLAAGRTPLTETGHRGSRNICIHWGQESFDQGGMVREFVKWDYEARSGQPVEALVDRAIDVAMSEPRGPVYLTLPREVLADPATASRRDSVRPMGTTAAEPAREAIAEAARLIANAQFPLILTSSAGRDPEAVGILAALAEEFALPVVQSEARDLNLPTDHPMHVGFSPNGVLPRADVVVVVDADVPWIPRNVSPRADAKIIHIASDPLATGFPFREFEADLLVAGSPRAAFRMLHEALRGKIADTRVTERRETVRELHDNLQRDRDRMLARVRGLTPIHPALIAEGLNALKANDAIVVNELGIPVTHLNLTRPGTFMGNLLSGGLGFGLGAALGAKLAAPNREVIAVVGDGSYMFGNPVPFHFVARAENLPTLTILNNNQEWHAVRRATLDVYPDGAAAKSNAMPLVDLKPSPDFEKVIESCGGLGLKVTTPEELKPALERGFAAIRSGTPALINVLTQATR